MLKIEFKTGNAYLRTEDDEVDMYVVAEMLRDIADTIENGSESGVVMDGNGNKIGTYKLED